MTTKKQHYAPQMYLDAFAPAGHLYVFDKTSGRDFPSSVRDAASSRFFYDVPEIDSVAGVPQAVEKFFQPFEEAAASVLRELRGSLTSGTFVSVGESQRVDLSLFLALQLLRTPETRETLVQGQLALRKELFIRWARDRRPDLGISRSNFDLEMNEQGRRAHHAFHLLDEEFRLHIANILFSHAWVVLENRFEAPFISSDHPCCNHGTLSVPGRSMQGLASPGAEILFPLSPTHLLLIAERTSNREADRLDGSLSDLTTKENVVYYNHWQVRHCYRFLYSSARDFSLARSMIEETPEIANPNAPRVCVR